MGFKRKFYVASEKEIKLFFVVLASIAIHLSLFFLVRGERVHETPGHAQQKVHYTRLKTYTKLLQPPQNSVTASTQARGRLARKAGAAPSDGGAKSYSDLLPSRFDDANGTVGEKVTAGVGNSMALDHQSQLQGFARELTERLDVPVQLYRVVNSGEAEIVLGQLDDRWYIRRVVGEPYIRVILQRAAQELLATAAWQKNLAQLGVEEIPIKLSFRVAMSNDLTVSEDKRSWRLSGQTVEIAAHQIHDAPEWMMLNAAGINLIGIGIYAAEKINGFDPDKDEELSKIRKAAAFRGRGQ